MHRPAHVSFNIFDEKVTKYVRAVMIIQRNSLPTPMMPPILVSRVRGGMVRWDLVTSTLRSKVTNNPYLSCRLSNPILVVLYLNHSE